METSFNYFKQKRLLADIKVLLYRICCKECDLVSNIEILLDSDTDVLNACVGIPIELEATVFNSYGPTYYLWEFSDDGINYTEIENSQNSSIIYATTGVSEGTVYFRVTASDNCHSSSAILSFVINDDPDVFISADSLSLCTDEFASLHSEVFGGDGGNSYQWQEFIDNAWVNIVGANAADYISPALPDGEYTYRLVVTQNPYCESVSLSLVIIVAPC